MKKFWNKVKSARTWKRVTCMVLTLVMVFSLVPQEVEAWEKGSSEKVYKIWEWYRADTFDSLPTGQGYTRMLLVWESNNIVYSTKDCIFKTNAHTAGSPWGHTQNWNCIVGSMSDTVLLNEDLKTFISETDLGTLYADLNLYSGGLHGVKDGRACIQISANNHNGTRGGEIIVTHNCDAFDQNTAQYGWDEPYLAGYDLSCYGTDWGSGSHLGSFRYNDSSCYIMNPGYDNGDNDQFWALNEYIACDGMAGYGQQEKGTKFTVYFGKQAEYSVIESVTVASNSVRKIDSHTFLTGTTIVEPGGVLSIEGKCFLNGSIKNYGTIIIQNNGSLCPYRPNDQGASSGTIYNYGSLATYKAKDKKSSTVDGQPGEGIFIIMPSGVYAQTQSFGDLYFEKAAMLENHGTMILGRSLVAKQAQISNMSTGKVYFSRQPLDTWIPALDRLGNKAINYSDYSYGAYYYLTQDGDSYFGNAGTWNLNSALSGEQRTKNNNQEALNSRQSFIDNRIANWVANNAANTNYFPVKRIEYSWWTSTTYTYYYTESELRSAVERAAAKKAVYDKMAEYGLVSDTEKNAAASRYTYLKSYLDKYDAAYQKELEKLQQEAQKSFSLYSGVSTLDLQQQEVEFFRSNYIKNYTLSKDKYVLFCKSDAENKLGYLKRTLDSWKSSLDFYNRWYDSTDSSVRYVAARYEEALAEYNNYYYGDYQQTMNAMEQYAQGNMALFDALYAKHVYEVEAEAWKLYPDVAAGSTAAASAKTEKELALEIANCKAYLTSNYKTVTQYRLDLLQNAETRYTALTERTKALETLSSRDYENYYNYGHQLYVGNTGCKIDSYFFFGYSADWDSDENKKIDSYDSQNKKAKDRVWTGLNGVAIATYTQKELEEYMSGTYDPLVAALGDEKTLSSMYEAYLNGIVENAKTLYPNADAQSIYDSLYSTDKPVGEAALKKARTDYVTKQKTAYADEIIKLLPEAYVTGEIARLNSELEKAEAAYADNTRSNALKADIAVLEKKRAETEEAAWQLVVQDFGKWSQIDRSKGLTNYQTLMRNFSNNYSTFKNYLDQISNFTKTIGNLNSELAILQMENITQESIIRDLKTRIGQFENTMTQEDFVAALEMDARVAYPDPTAEEQQAKVEKLRAEYITLRKSTFFAELFSARFSYRNKTIDVEQATKAAYEQIEKEAMKLYPDYKEGYNYPTQTPKELASSADSFESLIAKYTK